MAKGAARKPSAAAAYCNMGLALKISGKKEIWGILSFLFGDLLGLLGAEATAALVGGQIFINSCSMRYKGLPLEVDLLRHPFGHARGRH